MSRKPKEIVAFGDFQTPDALALEATYLLARLGVRPATIIEPTCGGGAFLAAAACVFPNARLIGADVNSKHLAVARARNLPGVTLHEGNFFTVDWRQLTADRPQPWLILGNPPWVTVAGLSTIAADNAPARVNANMRGIDALTGKSNFDISEWMLDAYLGWLEDRPGTIAVLCKTAVARKVLSTAWKQGRGIVRARWHGIDARRHFGAAVEACFLVIETSPGATASTCEVYDTLEAIIPSRRFGRIDDTLVSDLVAFTAHRHLLTNGAEDVWRSGIKHDCAAVMELTLKDGSLMNGLGERVEVEDACLYPLMKSADVANARPHHGRKMLVTQHAVGEDTATLRNVAPATWHYLEQHAARLNARRSAIYRNRPPFAIFGVGTYSFAPWKVAISGLYKRLAFACIGPVNGKPVVFDDTVSFLPFQTEAEARQACALLNSTVARQCLESMIFWSDKRPITAALLRRISLRALASAREHAAA